jgi:hypothetical protein
MIRATRNLAGILMPMARSSDMTTKQSTPDSRKAGKDLTARELSAVQRHLAQRDDRPRLKLEDKKVKVGNGGTLDAVLLMDAVGTVDQDFFNGLVDQLVAVSTDTEADKISEGRLNFMLSVIKGVKPRDQVEAMLAAQMAAVHLASMSLAQQLVNAQSIDYQDSAERAFNKLTRTFATQMEALKRYRARAEQSVTIQNVSVQSGGQAVVGNVAPNLAPVTVAETAALPPAGASKPPSLRIVGKPKPADALKRASIK